MNACYRFGIVVLFLCPSPKVCAGVRLENNTDNYITVWWKAQGDEDWRKPPITIKGGGGSHYLNVPAGVYRIYTSQGERAQDLGWHKFENSKITYSLKACAPTSIQPVGRRRRRYRSPPPVRQVFGADISHAESYRCPECGQIHTRWVPEWQSKSECG